MEMPTLTQLSTLRSVLSARLGDLRAQVRAAERRRRDAEGTSLRDAGGTPEAGDVDVAAGSRNEVDEMEEVEAALQRLDRGVYGACLHCRDPIGLQRLMRQPALERCDACEPVDAWGSDADVRVARWISLMQSRCSFQGARATAWTASSLSQPIASLES